MDALLPVINQLQEVFSTVQSPPIPLPRLAVVGGQSSGKSSVLECIVGRDFLPRGTGVVTRCPLTLQLVNEARPDNAPPPPPPPPPRRGERAAPAAQQPAVEWGEFRHLPGRRFTDFDEIRREILAETARLAGPGKAVSGKHIRLAIHSPSVLDITLVDLPGLTRLAVADQPSDIDQQIRAMVLREIRGQDAIIVAVTPANADLATSDALQIAREVDPHGARTLGVLTKVDLMDKGTDAVRVLDNRVVRLRHGFVGVVNRSQEDIAARVSIRQALQNEERFFRTHPSYGRMARRMGTRHLAGRLNALLLEHIKASLPRVRASLAQVAEETREELASYGEPLVGRDADNRGRILLSLLSRFSAGYADALDGKTPALAGRGGEMYGGARISHLFHDVFGRALDRFAPADVLTEERVRVTIRNATGTRPNLFVPELAFELLVREQIRRFEEPGLECVDLVYDELRRVAEECAAVVVPELGRFPALHAAVHECVMDMLRGRIAPTKDMIRNLVMVEEAYINTKHPDFLAGAQAVSKGIARSGRERGGAGGGGAGGGGGGGVDGREEGGGRREADAPSRRASAAPASAAAEEKEPEDASEASRGFNSIARFFGGGRGRIDGGAPVANTPSRFEQQQQQPPQQQRKPQVSPSYAAAAARPPAGGGHARGRSASRLKAREQHQQKLFESPHPGGRRQQQHQQRQPGTPAAGGLRAELVASGGESLSLSEKELMESAIIRRLIDSYFGIVRRTTKDQVPKAIMCFMVNYSKANLHHSLVERLYRKDRFDELLREGDDVAEKRDACVQLLDILADGIRIVDSVGAMEA